MAITSTAMTTTTGPIPNGAIPWAYNAYTTQAVLCEEVVPAPGTDKALYVTLLTIDHSATSVPASVGSGESANNVETVIWGPIPFNLATQKPITFDHRDMPVKLADNKSLTVDVTGNVNIYVEGYTI